MKVAESLSPLTGEVRSTAEEHSGVDLLTEREASAFCCGCPSVRTLQQWRSERRGPKFIKLGFGPKAPVRYRKRDLVAWLDEQTVTTEGR